ncbi:GntR family transcriptional regulator [Neobacillus sp. PS3-12]|uniref:GntR family transcriptional regulator n=1 Tax=Neobacillus sp. PS3-12 TaxID=3070677 RepID=UPI0027E0DFAA|nr:GntR family transcriptional regulator [Neobacillus sp. PS3-12]WML55009.1 GntR family transcriptional regulator [Neobacillus sp. PS3-12]
MAVSTGRKYSTKMEMVYESLKEDIINGLLGQGQKIVAREVANKFGVSDIPVREALKKLEADGLVENIPHVGSRVSLINIKKAGEIFAIRLEMEAFATRLAATNADAKGIDELQKIVDEIDKYLVEDDVKQISRLNTAFHQKLYQLSGNEMLFEMILSLMDRSQYSKSVFALVGDRREKSNKEHQQIVDALRQGNPEEAEEALRAQKEYAFKALLDKLKFVSGEESR